MSQVPVGKPVFIFTDNVCAAIDNDAIGIWVTRLYAEQIVRS